MRYGLAALTLLLAGTLVCQDDRPAARRSVLWRNLKEALLSDGGQGYFESNIRDARLPR